MKLTNFCCLALCIALQHPAHAATPSQTAAGNAVSYVFASELGSGVYEMSGSNLQVYRLTPARRLRAPQESAPGIRLTLPLTFGFLDFSPLNVINNGLPSNIDSFSITPGIEFDFALRDDWRLVPYMRAGASVASGGLDGWLYGTGFWFEHNATLGNWDFNSRHELAFAGVTWRGDIPNDQFVRLRQAAELRRGVDRGWRSYKFEIGVYGIADFLIDPPAVPVTPGRFQSWQFEAGIMLGTRPAVRLWHFDAPRIGLGYRLAGDFSGWRLAIGTPL